jgi:hypothetical protein
MFMAEKRQSQYSSMNHDGLTRLSAVNRQKCAARRVIGFYTPAGLKTSHREGRRPKTSHRGQTHDDAALKEKSKEEKSTKVTMFIKKDLRKVPEILAESEKTGNPVVNLHLSKRQSEFRGSVRVLCEPQNLPALSSLQNLSLYDCDIQDVTGIGELASLEHLSLGRNPLTQLPEDFSKLHRLTSLWLDDCQLEQVPLPVLDLENLQELRLSNNRLDQLPDTLPERLTNLAILCVDGNRLTSLPDLHRLEYLVTLQARQNQLSTLPDLPYSLRLLHLSSNQIDTLPTRLEECTQLTHIYLNSNALTEFLINVNLWPNLAKLNLSNNRIAQLSPEFLLLFGSPDPVTGQCGDDGIVGLRDNPVLETTAMEEEEEKEDNDDPMDVVQPPAITTA